MNAMPMEYTKDLYMVKRIKTGTMTVSDSVSGLCYPSSDVYTSIN